MAKPGMSPLSRILTRATYGMRQLPRVAWYVGHGVALRRLSAAARRQNAATVRPRGKTEAPVPERSRLYADMAELFMQDIANVEAGIYPIPADHDGSHAGLVARMERSGMRVWPPDFASLHPGCAHKRKGPPAGGPFISC